LSYRPPTHIPTTTINNLSLTKLPICYCLLPGCARTNQPFDQLFAAKTKNGRWPSNDGCSSAN